MLIFQSSISPENRNPNGDATLASKHSIDLESLKRLASHYSESLPAPSLLSSAAAASAATAAAKLMSSEPKQQNETHENSPSISPLANNQNSNNDIIMTKPENDGGRFVVVESMQQQQSQFIHHALSSAKNRHRRSLTMGSSNSNLNRRLIKQRYLVKRNFPNNQLSKASNEMDVDDSNETELDGIGDGENDDYVEREEVEKEQEKQLNVLNGHDRLDDENNESDLEKSMKLFVPYWDAYDTVNQLFLEISEYTLNIIFPLRHFCCVTNCMANNHLL